MSNTNETLEQPSAVENKSNETTPKLRCIVTGKARLTNRAYLVQKAVATNGDVEKFLSLYISRPALKHLRKGKSLEETRHALNNTCNDPISPELLEEALKLNGKWSR